MFRRSLKLINLLKIIRLQTSIDKLLFFFIIIFCHIFASNFNWTFYVGQSRGVTVSCFKSFMGWLPRCSNSSPPKPPPMAFSFAAKCSFSRLRNLKNYCQERDCAFRFALSEFMNQDARMFVKWYSNLYCNWSIQLC